MEIILGQVKKCFVGSCNGILCIADGDKDLVILWNPSIRKFKELPLIQKPNSIFTTKMTFGFGYDSFTDNYKVLVVLRGVIQDSSGNFVCKIEVKVHASNTNDWKKIQGYPFGFLVLEKSGEFVSGKINWLASIDFEENSSRFIVSFDLEEETYQKILLPDNGGVNVLALGVLKDCLCVTSGDDVWVMKEYGNKDSWTKLFTLSSEVDRSISHVFAKEVYFFEDDQVFMKLMGSFNLFYYDSRNGTIKYTNFDTILGVSIESLISPSS